MDPLEAYCRNLSRRQVLGGVTGGALGLLGGAAMAALQTPHHLPHFPARAKRVIYLFQEGAPSQLDTLDHKPSLKKLDGQDLRTMPEIQQGQRLTGMTANQSTLLLKASPFRFLPFKNHQGEVYLSELLSHTGRMAHEICLIRSMHTDAINHGPGVTLMQTGSQLAGRPTIGAWLSYGLGSESEELPAFVVLVSQGVGQMPALLSRYWGSAFLPSEHQGVRLRSGQDAVLFLNNPDGMNRQDRRKMLDIASRINAREAQRHRDDEVLARMAQYEMAYRMQTAVPNLTDISNETQQTLEMYGPDVNRPGTFAANCLLARRLAERGVRFIQLYHRGWDSHSNVPRDLPTQCKDVDQPQAALLQDLKRLGMLEDTLVLWGGEFGRTAYAQSQNKNVFGRDHHPRSFSVWLAGGGVQPGITYGASAAAGYSLAENPVHVHDLHATMLHLLGIDHKRLTFRYQGRDYRLTDVHGKVISELVA